MEFEFKKIDHVRDLNSFTRLKIDQPSAIILRNVDRASVETLNAFLKNLEEPQVNIKYILTASSEHKLLPTIISRCQVIKIQSSKFKITSDKTAGEFPEKDIGQKLLLIDKIRKREEAQNFLENIIISLHQKLNSENNNYSQIAHNLKVAQTTLNNIALNGNVTLQLASFVINL